MLRGRYHFLDGISPNSAPYSFCPGWIRLSCKPCVIEIHVRRDFVSFSRIAEGNLPDMPLLKGVKTDLLNMQRTFETLKFAVLSHQDCSATQMMSLFHDISTFSEYPPSYRRIAVVFAGHGMEGSLCAHDGTVPIEEIIDQFQPANCHPSIGGIPKLFFIDACRGKRKMASVVVERGATAVPSKIVSPRGNILVAYSTLEGYKAHEVEEGGIWVTELSKQLLQDMSLTDVIINVNKTLQEKYQDSALSRYLQQPECIITINECINLLKESTGAPSSNYRKDLNEWCQQEGTEVPRKFEQRSTPNGHKCTITVRKRQFSSEWQVKKRDAEEEAATKAMLWLRQQQPVSLATQNSPTASSKPGKAQLKEYLDHHTELQMTTNYNTVHTTTPGTPFQCTLTTTSPSKGQTAVIGNCCSSIREAEHDAADKVLLRSRWDNVVPSAGSSRNFKQELNEWCQRNKVQAPRDYKPTGQSYVCTITIEGREFASKLCSRKKDAEEDAAMKAVQWLQRLQPTTPPSAGQPGSMRLKEYCEHHPEKKLTLSYELLPAPLNGPFQCRLTITPLKGSKIEVTGDLCKSKQDAKHSAADKALQQLG
eukprot:Em0022g187a